MRRIVSLAIILVFIVVIFVPQSPCFAQNMLRKLGRGVGNVTTSVFEIPKSIQEIFYDEGPLAAGTYGILDGIYKFLVRTVVGAYEIVSFPIPIPGDYAPIIEPEFLFSRDED